MDTKSFKKSRGTKRHSKEVNGKNECNVIVWKFLCKKSIYKLSYIETAYIFSYRIIPTSSSLDIYIYIYIYSIHGPVKPELGIIPSGQEIILKKINK